MRLPPGQLVEPASHEDDFIHVLEGELTLIEDSGEPCSARAIAPPSRRQAATAIT